jgi:hypothetical protein
MNRKNKRHFDPASPMSSSDLHAVMPCGSAPMRSRPAPLSMLEGVGALHFPGRSPGISKPERSRMLGASPPCRGQSDGVKHLPCCRAETMIRSVSGWAYEMRIEQAASRQ